MERPSFEHEGNSQERAEEELVRRIKEKGPTDPESRTLINDWLEKREQELAKDPISSIRFNITRAKFYFKIGLIEEAFENLESALDQAWNEHRDELCEEIEREIRAARDKVR